MNNIEELFARYINHIGEEEGIYFLGHHAIGIFTEEEITYMKDLANNYNKE